MQNTLRGSKLKWTLPMVSRGLLYAQHDPSFLATTGDKKNEGEKENSREDERA